MTKPKKRIKSSEGIKTHCFHLNVQTFGDRKSAELDVLCAFANRKPDGCSFKLNPNKSLEKIKKEYWMQGSRAGCEIAYDLITKALFKLGNDLKLNRKNK